MIDRKVKIIKIADKIYPESLKNIPDPPKVLYCLGNLEVLRKNIAVVGTRQITKYGQFVTAKLVKELVENNITIVSGMALGVDGVAHRTALENGGKTVAVLGAGVDVIYPREHKDLYNSILESGNLLISEVPPGTLVERKLFPARNRIISGLSEAVLITEAAIDSGSLITARMALEQGKEVLAVPGPITSKYSEGTNYLLKQGAKLVTSVEDILETL